MKRILVLILSMIILLSLCGCDSSEYEKAMSLYNSGEYQEAMDIFLELGDYEDSGKMAAICACKAAEEYAEKGMMAEVVELLSAHSTIPMVQETLFVIFSNEITDNYLVNFQAALDSWNEYLPIWMRELKESSNNTPVGGTVNIPKVDMEAPQVIALQRSMEKANKSVSKLREAYNDDILNLCDEDVKNVIDKFFVAAETIDKQFQSLDSWATTILFYSLQDNNAAKANNAVMNALYDVQDAAEVLMDKYG